jgi:hypothetical protein
MRTNKVSRLSSKSLVPKWPVLIGSIALAAALLSAYAILQAASQSSIANDLSQQIFDTMLKVHGTQPRTRPVHAKGPVCDATFTPCRPHSFDRRVRLIRRPAPNPALAGLRPLSHASLS